MRDAIEKSFISTLIIVLVLGAFGVISTPRTASAHEVYVLTPQQISQMTSTASPNPFTAIPGHEKLFLFWGALIAISLLLVLTASVTPVFESVFDRFLIPLKTYAPLVGRLTFGVAMIYSGYHGAFFGPELMVNSVVPAAVAQILAAALMVGGVFVCLGLLTRLISILMLALFLFTVCIYGWYMITYVNYLGEIVLFCILGSGIWSLDALIPPAKKLELAISRQGIGRLAKKLEPYSFLILRVLFGAAVFFASFYAKFFNSNLALMTVNEYHLTDYFHFSPLFLVLGAFIVEALLGLCFALGFEIRLASLVFTFFLTLSILFFGEAVWPHVILFGVNIVLFFHGYDKYTLEMAVIQRQRKGEPVL